MCRGAFDRLMVSQCRLAAALGHDLSTADVTTNATPVAAYRTDMYVNIAPLSARESERIFSFVPVRHRPSHYQNQMFRNRKTAPTSDA
jgi:hypothetical protein